MQVAIQWQDADGGTAVGDRVHDRAGRLMEGRRYCAAEMITRQVAVGAGAVGRIHRHGERPLEAQHGGHDLAPDPG